MIAISNDTVLTKAFYICITWSALRKSSVTSNSMKCTFYDENIFPFRVFCDFQISNFKKTCYLPSNISSRAVLERQLPLYIKYKNGPATWHTTQSQKIMKWKLEFEFQAKLWYRIIKLVISKYLPPKRNRYSRGPGATYHPAHNHDCHLDNCQHLHLAHLAIAMQKH